MTNELKYLNNNLEEKVKNRTQKLKDSEQYALKLVEDQDIFVKNAIHEINTPLSIIIMNIDLFKLKFKASAYLSKIEAGAKIIHNIYNDLSYMIKKDRITYEKENINFSKYLLFRIEFFDEVALGNNLKINTNIQNDIYINFNETQLQRICDNSLSNAIKYSYEDTIININLVKNYNDIILTITNHSDNIQNTSELFKRYYRENNTRGGFGMGLNIIKEICDKSNVEISLSSKENITTFEYIFKVEA